MDRRDSLPGAAVFGFVGAACAGEVTDLRIGYQKTAVLLVVKARKLLEQRFAPKGISVKWVEFSFGLQRPANRFF